MSGVQRDAPTPENGTQFGYLLGGGISGGAALTLGGGGMKGGGGMLGGGPGGKKGGILAGVESASDDECSDITCEAHTHARVSLR